MYEGKLTRLRRLETKDASTILPLWNNYELRQYLQKTDSESIPFQRRD